MSRKLLAFFLHELQTVRVICQHQGCGGVIEVPIEKLDEKFQNPTCPLCKQLLTPIPDHPFLLLARAVRGFGFHKNTVQIEFVLPDED